MTITLRVWRERQEPQKFKIILNYNVRFQSVIEKSLSPKYNILVNKIKIK